MRIRVIFFISLALSLILTPLMKALAMRWKILDIPNRRKLHKTPIPLLGGEAVYKQNDSFAGEIQRRDNGQKLF